MHTRNEGAVKTYFLSYARLDQAFALRLAKDLEAAGVDVWVDQLHIGVGQNWDRGVEAAIRACEGFIIVLSPQSVASENVADEVNVALDGGKQIIPILHEKCTIPMRLGRVQFIDATSDYPEALQRCKSLILGAQPADTQSDAPRPRRRSSNKPPPDSKSAPISKPATADATSVAADLPKGLDAQVLHQAEHKLVVFVGPVARMLVRKAALATDSKVEFYRQLAASIPKENERLAFLESVNIAPVTDHPARSGAGKVTPAPSSVRPPTPSSAPAATPPSPLPPALSDKLCQILTAHLGPIARHVLAREAREAKDRDDLYRRLGARIPTDKERAELLRILHSY
jgi:hypothetical protein